MEESLGRMLGLTQQRQAPQFSTRDCTGSAPRGLVSGRVRPRALALPAATAAKVLCFISAPPAASRSPQAAEALARAHRCPIRTLLRLQAPVSLRIRLTVRYPQGH